LGEYLVVLLQEVKRRPTAIVAETLGGLRKNESAWQVIDCQSIAPAPSEIALTLAALSRVSNLVPGNDTARDHLRAGTEKKSRTARAGTPQHGQ
jgi:hypothetical protein